MATRRQMRGPRLPLGLAVDLHVRQVEPIVEKRESSVVERGGVVVVEGQVSVGRRGWHFSAEARRRRKRVTVHLVGRRDDHADRAPDIETYAYELVVHGLTPGVYEIYVTTAFPIPGTSGTMGGEPHFAGRVTVPASPD